MTPTRRRVLGGTGALVGAALAGCADSVPGLGDGGSGRSTPTQDFDEWLPAPAAIGKADYEFGSTAPAALLDRRDDLGEGAVEDYEGQFDFSSIDSYADMTAIHRVTPWITIIEGDFEAAAMIADLEERDLREVGDHEGYALLTPEDGGAAAVGDGVLVSASPSGLDTRDKLPHVEAVVDAKSGSGTRYRDAVDSCDRLLEELDDAHLLTGRTHPPGESFDGALAEGLSVYVSGDETAVQATVVFEDGATDETALGEWAANADVFYGADPNTSSDGRVAHARATVDSAEIEAIEEAFPGQERNDE